MENQSKLDEERPETLIPCSTKVSRKSFVESSHKIRMNGHVWNYSSCACGQFFFHFIFSHSVDDIDGIQKYLPKKPVDEVIS